MKHGRSQHPCAILAPAARAALRFAARRNAPGRHGAWRPVALFWRQQRKEPKGLRAVHAALAAAAVWLPQFHLHFITRPNDRPQRDSMPRLSPVVVIHQRPVVMDHLRTIVQSGMYAAQPRRDQRPEHAFSMRQARSGSGARAQAATAYTNSARRLIVPPVATQPPELDQRPAYGFSLRGAHSGSGANVQAAAAYTNSARRLIVSPVATRPPELDQRPAYGFSLRSARNGSGTNVQAAAAYTNSARRPIVAPTTARAADRAQLLNLGRTHPSVRLGTRTDAQAQTLQTLRTSKREPLVFRPRSKAMSNAAPPYSQESTAPQPYFHPQELVWRRAVPPTAGSAGNEWQADSHELTQQSLGRSFRGQETASGMPHPFGRTPAPPAMKLDSALMDRLADDVIRRVERRERIERARRGL